MVKENKGVNLKELKKEYELLCKKYKLPLFREVNELFEIEEVNIETDFLLRRIRRTIIERISVYFRLVEVLLNPSTAPLFFFRNIKKLELNDRDKLSSLYESLGNIESESILVDLDYSEEKEAEFIKKIFTDFKAVKGDIAKIIEKLIVEKNNEAKESKGSYLG